MADINLVILAQIVLFVAVCLGPILVFASWIKNIGKSDEDEKRRQRR